MKSIHHCLKELQEPYKSKALKNFKRTLANDLRAEKYDKMEVTLAAKYSTIPDALSAAFVWSDMPEGGDYWYQLYNVLSNKKAA